MQYGTNVFLVQHIWNGMVRLIRPVRRLILRRILLTLGVNLSNIKNYEAAMHDSKKIASAPTQQITVNYALYRKLYLALGEMDWKEKDMQ